MARKSKLNEELINRAAELVNAGHYDNTVFTCLGIGETTWYRWINLGEEDFLNGKNTIVAKFWESVSKARAAAEIRNLEIVQTAANDDWKAAAWFLERKYNEKWGRKEKTELTGKNGGPVEISNAKELLMQKINDMVSKKEEPEE